MAGITGWFSVTLNGLLTLRNFKDDFPKKPLMILSPSIRSWFRHRIQWVKTHPLLSFLNGLLLLLFSTFVFVLFSENPTSIYCALGLSEKHEVLKFLGIGMGGILLAMQAVIANRRAKAMEETAKAQAKATEEQASANRNTERGQRQERLKNAIEHLGHAADAVRLGGAYELFHLAQDTEDLRQTILDILCAHIQQTTGENKYRKKYKSEPSEEINILLALLFENDHKIFEGLEIHLQGSWLNGAEFFKADLRWAVLSKAYLQNAWIEKADLREACLTHAQMDGADLNGAHLHGTDLYGVQLQGADLKQARLHGAYLIDAQLQGAILEDAQLQGAYLVDAQMHGVRCEEDTYGSFEQRMRQSIGRESDLSKVTLAGGLSQENVDSLVKNSSEEKANSLRETLTPHIGMPESNELPKNSGAVIGAYTEEEAEQWIAEYKVAMSKFSPKMERYFADIEPADT